MSIEDLQNDLRDSEEALAFAEQDVVVAQDWAIKCKARRDSYLALIEREKLEDIRNDNIKSL